MDQKVNKCRNCAAPKTGKVCRHCGAGTHEITIAKPEEKPSLFRNPFSALFGLFDSPRD
jgi:predicted RNA-binding protein with PUA domain